MYANLFMFRQLFSTTDGLPALGKHVHVELWKNCNTHARNYAVMQILSKINLQCGTNPGVSKKVGFLDTWYVFDI